MRKIIFLALIAISAFLAGVQYPTIGLPSWEDDRPSVIMTVGLAIVAFTTIANYTVYRRTKEAVFCFINGVITLVTVIFLENMMNFFPKVIELVPKQDSALLLIVMMMGILYLPLVYAGGLYIFIHYFSGLKMHKFYD